MYMLQWRRVTAQKGTPKEVNVRRHLQEDELKRELAEVLPQAMWVYVEDEDRMSA